MGRWHWRRRRRAELEAKLARLQGEIDELRDEIRSFEEGISDVTRLNEPVDTAIAKLEARRDALQEKIDAL